MKVAGSWCRLTPSAASGFVCFVVAGGARKSLYFRRVLLFVGALLSWLHVLANRRIIGVIGCVVFLRGRRRGPENRCTLGVFCSSLLHCFLGFMC